MRVPPSDPGPAVPWPRSPVLSCLLSFLQALAVHLVKIAAVLPAQDVLPPVLIVQIPLNGLADARVKCILGLPAKLRLNLCGVNGIAPVVARPVRHKADQALGLPKL